MRWLVTGTNRGIGLELVRLLSQRGDSVVATVRSSSPDLDAIARDNPAVRIVRADLPADVGAIRAALEREPLDVLVANAGVMGGMTSLEDLDLDDARHTFDTNVIGALAVVQVALAPLERGNTRKIVAISSGMGSIGDNTSGGAYAYRMSKAALNMAVRSMSVDLAARRFTCVTMNPGWVQTDMGGPGAPTPLDVAGRNIIARIDGLGAEHNGRFLDAAGGEWEW